MLDQPSAESFDSLILAAPCRMALLPELSGTGAPPGAAACALDERRTVRIPAHQRAAIELRQPLPAFPRAAARGQAIVNDVAIRGLRVLFDQQLFPGERITIWLPDVELSGEVARCRRLAEQCFEIGVRLDVPLPAGLLKQFFAARRQGE